MYTIQDTEYRLAYNKQNNVTSLITQQQLIYLCFRGYRRLPQCSVMHTDAMHRSKKKCIG